MIDFTRGGHGTVVIGIGQAGDPVRKPMPSIKVDDLPYDEGRIQGVIGIGGAQGTEIACAAMRTLPTGVPRLMASTVANGPHQFGFYMGTKDLTIMHTVSDMQGLNFLTKRILENSAGAICGMVKSLRPDAMKAQGKAAGATGWLVKPFDPQKLLEVVKKVIG